MSDFYDKIAGREFGIVTYGMTPPKVSTDAAKLPALAATQAARIRALPVDAVIMYDIHDEKDRAGDTPRPFPFSETLDGMVWARDHLGDVGAPYVHFRCIAKHTPEKLQSDFERLERGKDAVVIVGAAASSQELPMTMQQAYELRARVCPDLAVGAVCIPERHTTKGDEHVRMWRKQTEGGVSFFVTQCVYNLEEAKNMLSDYQRQCNETGTPMVPVLVTLTPCGSPKTLEFLAWLGVKVSKWLQNDLTTTADILEESVTALVHLFADLAAYAAKKKIPLGCNVESVAIRKAEIEASVRLVHEARRILEEYGAPAAEAEVAQAATA